MLLFFVYPSALLGPITTSINVAVVEERRHSTALLRCLASTVSGVLLKKVVIDTRVCVETWFNRSFYNLSCNVAAYWWRSLLPPSGAATAAARLAATLARHLRIAHQLLQQHSLQLLWINLQKLHSTDGHFVLQTKITIFCNWFTMQRIAEHV